MIKVQHIEVMNFEAALRGMRNPLESWDKGDSKEDFCCLSPGSCIEEEYCRDCTYSSTGFYMGKNDLKLAQKLIRAGSDHSKFMRQIFVSMDITAPRLWWSEMDTYKVGTVANSCSTMHKLATTPITKSNFSISKEADNIIYFTDTNYDTAVS